MTIHTSEQNAMEMSREISTGVALNSGLTLPQNSVQLFVQYIHHIHCVRHSSFASLWNSTAQIFQILQASYTLLITLGTILFKPGARGQWEKLTIIFQ